MQPIQHAETSVAAQPGRLRSAWRAAHEPVAGVPRWLQRTAYAVPLVVLPSSLWRLPSAFDGGINPYILFLSAASELLAFTAIGLVARWGEVFPRWLPGLRGRRVPTKAAVIPAAIGAVLLTAVFTVLAVIVEVQGTTIRGGDLPDDFPTQAGGLESAWFYACYTPLILWGPLLAVLTVAYYRRRHGAGMAVAA